MESGGRDYKNMSMKQIRLKIIDLIEQHGDTFGKCEGCPICKEILHLRKQLDRDSTVRFKHILDKGPDMTKSDIAFLLENDVQKNQIKKVVGLVNIDFYEMMFNYGFSKFKPKRRKGKRGRKKEMAKLEMTVEEFVDLKYEQKLPITQIAKQKGVADPTVYHWMKKNKDAINALAAFRKPDAAVEMETLPEIKTIEKEGTTAPIKALESKTIQESIKDAFAEQTAEYERLIKALRNDLNTINNQLDEKDELIGNLQAAIEKYDHVNAACEDVENELANLQEKNEWLQFENERLQDENSHLLHESSKMRSENINMDLENNALKQLVKLWL